MIGDFYKKYFSIIIVVSVILISAVIRYDRLEIQMPVGDDSGVAWTLIEEANKGYPISYVRMKIYNASHEDHNTVQYKFLRFLDRHNELEGFLINSKNLLRLVAIPQAYTYAPFQFIFTAAFLSQSDLSYRQILFWGRLPSLIFSVFGLAFFVWLFYLIDKNNYFYLGLGGLLLMAFSWEDIIFSRHMSSYAIGVFAVTALMCLLLVVLDITIFSWRKKMSIGFALSLLASMQYQVLFFIPAFFLTWFLTLRSDIQGIFNKKEMSVNIKNVLLTGVIFFVFYSPVLFAFVLPQASRGASGFTAIPEDFYFRLPEEGVISIIKYSFYFLFVKGFSVLRFITAYIDFNSSFSIFTSWFVVLFSIFGLIMLLRSSNKKISSIGIFNLLVICTWIGLVIMRKVAFSPTRHSLIYLPIIASSFSYSVWLLLHIFKKYFNKIGEIIFVILLFFVIVVPFFLVRNRVENVRTDSYSHEFIAGLIDKYKPQYVLQSSLALWGRDEFKGWERFVAYNQVHTYLYESNDNYNQGVYMLLSQVDTPIEPCSSDFIGFGRLVDVCNRDGDVLYDYKFNNNATIDISGEARAIYNQFSVQIIKF